jgi:hypothetical protein
LILLTSVGVSRIEPIKLVCEDTNHDLRHFNLHINMHPFGRNSFPLTVYYFVKVNFPLTQFLSGFRKIAFYRGGLSSIKPEISILLLIILVTFLTMLALLQYKIFSFGRKQKGRLNETKN